VKVLEDIKLRMLRLMREKDEAVAAGQFDRAIQIDDRIDQLAADYHNVKDGTDA
jgi:hypothetical protein